MKSEVEHYENRCGGKGTMHIERLLQSEEMGSGVKMYAKVTIDVDASLGVHQHIGDGESYYILQGRALSMIMESSVNCSREMSPLLRIRAFTALKTSETNHWCLWH